MIEPLELPPIRTEVPETGFRVIEDQVYHRVEGRSLRLDLTLPDSAGPHPVVLLVHGEPVLEDGGRWWGENRAVKNSGPIRSWARLLASRGVAAVGFNRRSSEGMMRPRLVDEDLAALGDYLDRAAGLLSLDRGRTGLLAFSGGVPFALRQARQDPAVRAVVTLYGVLDFDDPRLAGWFPGAGHPVNQKWSPVRAEVPGPPHLHVWPWHDWLPNGARRYAAKAATAGWPFRLRAHPTGHHGFDFVDEGPMTAALIGEIAGFLTANLGVARAGS